MIGNHSAEDWRADCFTHTSLSLSLSLSVRVRARARACVCVCVCVISSGCHGSLRQLWMTFPGNICHCPLVIYSISTIRRVFVLKRHTTEETVYFDSRIKYIIVPFTS